jgi:hypothetical protein
MPISTGMTQRVAGWGVRARFRRRVQSTAAMSVTVFLLAVLFATRWWWVYPFLIATLWLRFAPNAVAAIRYRAAGVDSLNGLRRQVHGLESESFCVMDDLQGGGGTIDLAVVGPTGVFAIAVEGRMRFDPAGRGSRNDGAVQGASSDAAHVSRQLEKAGVAVPVTPVVALARAKLPKSKMWVGPVAVLEAAELVPFIRTHARKRLHEDETVRATAALLRAEALGAMRSIAIP